ncbi:MAG: hypothetical protein PVF87_03605 [Acidimicrobiia bacterium]|jgi:hypothetical protein
MGWKSMRDEWRARRAGRKGLESDLPRSARDIVGPTGWMWSRGWDAMAEHSRAYVDSFNRKIPPSIFVSERERTRHNIPIPLSERMISERHKRKDGDESPDLEIR